MPLRSIDDKLITSIPQKRLAQFNQWRRRLSENDYQRVVDSIRSKLQGHEVIVSTFLPGHDWTGTEFYPLYEACNRNQQFAAWFFGLICWQVMIDDDREWRFLKPADDEDIMGMKYFIPQQYRLSNNEE